MTRTSAIAIRHARANTYDPNTLENAEAFVVGGFAGLSIFGVLALTLAGEGQAIAAAVFATLAGIAGLTFVSALDIRSRQEGFRTHIGATAVGVWAVAEALAEPVAVDMARAA